MSSPIVSIIIPAYNGADFLGEAISSVLNQTYPHFEIIVVDDASPDHTAEVMKQFNDSRIKYIIHEKNRGAPMARKTGTYASAGEIIAYLDQDDYFHPEKLQTHVAFFQQQPLVGATYNARFELNYSSKTIRDRWQPPQNLSLADLVLGFPIAPSDLMLRREWAFQDDFWDENNFFHGGEIVSYGILFLAGCRFALIDQALTYHRHHAGRVIRNLVGNCRDYHAAQEKIFTDPRCPVEVVALHDLAYANSYVVWAGYALEQGETELAQDFIRQAIRLKPAIVEVQPCELVDFLVSNSIYDETQDHNELLKKAFSQLPPELSRLSPQLDWAIARGYLLRGTRAIIWDRPEDGNRHFARATELGAEIDEAFVQGLIHQVMGYEKEFGPVAAHAVLQRLIPYLEKLGNRQHVRRLKGCYSVNRAFQNYQAGKYNRVWGEAVRAIVSDPQYLTNRGVLAILFRSFVRTKLQWRVRLCLV